MDERNNFPPESREPDYYETGSTRPPKSHGGLIAFLLILVIFLCGLSSALGLLNIKLLSQQNSAPEASSPVILYPSNSDTAGNTTGTTQSTVPLPTGKVELELDKSPESVENVPQKGGLSLQAIYAGAIDSVVSISCTVEGGTSSGTGVVLSENGYIVTNAHVVEDAAAIQVRLTDNRVLPASIVGADAVSDLAVLIVDASDLSPADFGDSSALRVGDTVVAIGDPLGSEFRGTMTDGIVSAINREVSVSGRTMTLIQTNAALNSGNSGGPLLNCYGQVIGINTMKIGAFTDAAGVEGIGFAIPSTTVKEIVDQLIRQGFVDGRPSLGIQGREISYYYQKFYHLPAGVLITEVLRGGSAQSAGLRTGDIILGLNDTRITDMDTLTTALYACAAGESVTLTIYRAGTQQSVTLTLGEAGN